MIAAVLLAIGLLHIEKPYLETRCDVLELNHVFDVKAAPIMSQLIGWNWDDGQKHIDFWVLTGDTLWKQGATYRLDGRTAEIYWCDRWYRVNYGAFKETFTQYDPELDDRELWPKELRRELPERLPQ